MATEIFKETMQELRDDYVEYVKELNLTDTKGMKEQSLKLGFVEYCQLYMDYFAISMQDNDNDNYPEDDDFPEDDKVLDDEAPEETY